MECCWNLLGHHSIFYSSSSTRVSRLANLPWVKVSDLMLQVDYISRPNSTKHIYIYALCSFATYPISPTPMMRGRICSMEGSSMIKQTIFKSFYVARRCQQVFQSAPRQPRQPTWPRHPASPAACPWHPSSASTGSYAPPPAEFLSFAARCSFLSHPPEGCGCTPESDFDEGRTAVVWRVVVSGEFRAKRLGGDGVSDNRLG